MISSVSSVNFKGTAATMSPQDIINRPGTYSKPEVAPQNEPQKKSGKVWKGIAIATAGVLVAAGALFGAYKAGWVKVLPEAEKAGAKFLQKAGDLLAKGGAFIDEKIVSNIAKVFTRKTPTQV